MKLRAWQRILLWAVGGALALCLLIVLLCWLLMRGSLPQLDGELGLPFLGGSVWIERDALGTASIEGGSRRDVLRAQGFVHAQERYFEMDLMRRMAAGELSALLGKPMLEQDRTLRVHRFRERSRVTLVTLPPAERSLLQAYAEGVNVGLDALSTRPWPYLLLRQRPQRWETEDSLLVMYAMYIRLQWREHDRDLHFERLERADPVLAALLERAGGSWDAALLPPYQLEDPTLPEAREMDLRAMDPASFDVQPLVSTAPTGLEALHHLCAECLPGSNNWAVSGRNSHHGGALLANDMHLGHGVPNIWFRTRLRFPDRFRSGLVKELVGLSLPGTPGIVVGSNGHIAWGFTNSQGDWSDWVQVRLHPEDPKLYAVPDGWEPFTVSEQVIEIAGARSKTLSVTETRWGPVLAENEHGPLALSWVAHQPEALNVRLLELARSRTLEQAMEQATRTRMPSQNIVVVDRRGSIGWTMTGPIPLRGGFDGRRAADFSTPGSGWVGWLAPDAYPRVVNPDIGRVWSANSRVVGLEHLRLVGDGGYALGVRGAEIRSQLLALPKATEQDMLKLQLHERSSLLDGWHALLEQTLSGQDEDAELYPLRQAIADFDGHARSDSVSYRLVRGFRTAVSESLLNALYVRARSKDPELEIRHTSQAEHLLWRIVSQQPAHLLPPNYADWNALFLAVARDVYQELDRQPGGLTARTWGERNQARIQHPLSLAVPRLSRWLDMPADPLPGDVHVPRVQTPGFGASQRLVVSPGREDQGLLHMPGGQSGHPMSPFYAAGHEDWVHGRPTALLPGPAVHRLELFPRRD